MHVVIVGAGAVGSQIAGHLIEEGADVVLIEKDEETARLAADRLDCLVLNEEGNRLETLKQAQIEKADFFISVTDSDEVNIVSCGLVSSEFSVPIKIARIRNIDYSSARLLEKPFLGIDYVANPEIEAARVIIRSIERGAVSDVMMFESGSFQMRNYGVHEGSPFLDRSIEAARAELAVPFLVALVERENGHLIPSGDTVLREGDNLYLVGTEESLERVFERAGRRRVRLGKILIVGGGRIGRYVAEYLLKRRGAFGPFARLASTLTAGATSRSVAIIDRDPRVCRSLSEDFPEALIIQADISDEGVIEENRFSDYDLVIAATNNQELNLVTGVYAKSLGIKRSLALVNKSNYLHIATNLGIDVPISLKNSLVNTILKFIRRGNIRSVHSLSGGRAEMIELSVEAGSPAAGRRLRDVRFPRHSLVVFVVRAGESLIPDGDFEIRGDDHVILVADRESVNKVQDLFSVPA